MSQNTKIEWCDATWNPIVGCSRVDAGCDHCYAIPIARRLAMHPEITISNNYRGLTHDHANRLDWTGNVTLISERLQDPLTFRKKPTVYFVNSMSDMFHRNVSTGMFNRIMQVCKDAEQHKFLILTKRPERISSYRIVSETGYPNSLGYLEKIDNVWIGVSVSDQKTADERIPELLRAEVAHRFVSYEPALGPVNIERIESPVMGRIIEWVIAGGESGPKARPAHPDWFRTVRDQCKEANVPFFYKQHGEWLHQSGFEEGPSDLNWRGLHYWEDGTISVRIGKKHAGRLLDGVQHDERPW